MFVVTGFFPVPHPVTVDELSREVAYESRVEMARRAPGIKVVIVYQDGEVVE